METQIKDSNNNFLAKLRESLGINSQWKMAQRLNLNFRSYNSAETRGGLPSEMILRRLVEVFGWAKIAKSIRSELEHDSNNGER